MKPLFLPLFLLVPLSVSAQDGGYEQDTIFTDGPIIYGTGLSDADRSRAWKQFSLLMIQSLDRQQGREALGVKTTRRCLPNQDFCSVMLDANLVGIGGIQEPRRVLLIIASDVKDPEKQLSRVVCTWPNNDTRVCRDWDTGKLLPDITRR
jgi:hypothetical protein